MGTPILGYQPGGGVPTWIPGLPPTAPGAITGGDITQLVNGQSYITIVFDVAQANSDWEFVECIVVNDTDLTPLNIWPGIVTAKSTTGFTLQFNGMPDSANYFLHWSFTGIGGGTAINPFATTYLLSGPSSGTVGAPSATFTVQLPSGKLVPVSVTVTPSDGGGGGTFTPTSVTLTTGAPSATFTYTAASAGTKTISTSNDGGLTDPAGLTYTATASTIATTYTLSGPSSGVISAASTNFTVALPGGMTVPGPVTVTPSAASGTFTPTSVILTTAAPSATFTYTPSTYGAKTVSTTNSSTLTDPTSLTYTSVAGTYTLTGPSSGTVSVASTNFTVALPAGGVLLSTVTITPNDSGGGGAFTPTTVNLTTGAPSATFTYTPSTTGTKTVSVTNSGSLTNPGSISYNATTAFGGPDTIAGLKLWLKADAIAGPPADGAAVTAWNDSSSNGYNVTGGPGAIFKTGIVNGKPVVRFNGTTQWLLSVTDIGVSQPNTWFIVGKQPSNTVECAFIHSSTSGDQLVSVFTSGHFYLFAGTVAIDSVDFSAAFHNFSGILSGGNGTAYIDGNVRFGPSAVGSGVVGPITMMADTVGGTAFPGDIAEIILYNSALGTTDRQNVEGYLRTKYALP